MIFEGLSTSHCFDVVVVVIVVVVCIVVVVEHISIVL